MAGKRPIIVVLPSPTGGRRVRVNGEILGLAHNVQDLVEFLAAGHGPSCGSHCSAT
ncbi:hypothetical protein ACIRU3_46345 [Streptomyces sp. NPDC101151]|uniref:hypothetical protein n=1 Tax=Streptomyces sp. NPDC101151 TaxID=3366115 RepID=UPI0038300ECB